MKKHQMIYNRAEDGYDIYVTCPYCDNCESHPVDEQRHHLQNFEIHAHLPDIEGKNERSIMKCCVCEEGFELEWIYIPEKPFKS